MYQPGLLGGRDIPVNKTDKAPVFSCPFIQKEEKYNEYFFFLINKQGRYIVLSAVKEAQWWVKLSEVADFRRN